MDLQLLGGAEEAALSPAPLGGQVTAASWVPCSSVRPDGRAVPQLRALPSPPSVTLLAGLPLRLLVPASACLGRPQPAPFSAGRMVDVPRAPGDGGMPVARSSRRSGTLAVRSANPPPAVGTKGAGGVLKRAAKPDPGKAAACQLRL